MQNINLTKALTVDASKFLIAGNDAHGLLPSPTHGQRTPLMPHVHRNFYENEFNQKAKNYFLSACKRCGFRTIDVKPEQNDTQVNIRARKSNQSGANALVTFAYSVEKTNTNKEQFNNLEGISVQYSSYSPAAKQSRQLAFNIFKAFSNANRKIRPISTLNTSMLYMVNCPAALIKAGYLANFAEAKQMLDPDFQKQIGEHACIGVCNYFGVAYVSPQALNIRPNLKEGFRGDDVLYIQQKLYSKLYPLSIIDGVFTKDTTLAVKTFQQENSIETDGIINEKTLTALQNSAGRLPK